MARKYLVNLDLSKNELQNAVVQVLATAPTTGLKEGLVYYDSVLKVARIYNGTGWVSMEQNVAIDFGEVTDISTSAVGDTPAAGATGEVADAGHVHGRESFGTSASTQAIGDAQSAGSATTPSRSDHKHALPGFGNVTAETSAGGSSANGSATTVARSDHAHGTPAHTGTEHSSISLSSLSAPTGDLAIGGFKLTGVATPVSGTDAANKAYVDASRSGLDVKQSVRAATTAAITLATGLEDGDVIDGVSLVTGDRVLVKNQGSSENGIYVVAASGAPTRATDFDSSDEVTPGAFTFVEEGTVNADSGWVVTNDGAITIGSTTITFAQFSGAGQITAGAGLTKDGNTLDVGAGTGITVNANDVAIDTSVVARKYATAIGDGTETAYTVTHNLGTRDVVVQTYLAASTYDQVECDVLHATTNTVTVAFSTPPASNSIRVVCLG